MNDLPYFNVESSLGLEGHQNPSRINDRNQDQSQHGGRRQLLQVGANGRRFREVETQGLATPMTGAFTTPMASMSLPTPEIGAKVAIALSVRGLKFNIKSFAGEEALQ